MNVHKYSRSHGVTRGAFGNSGFSGGLSSSSPTSTPVFRSANTFGTPVPSSMFRESPAIYGSAGGVFGVDAATTSSGFAPVTTTTASSFTFGNGSTSSSGFTFSKPAEVLLPVLERKAEVISWSKNLAAIRYDDESGQTLHMAGVYNALGGH